MSRERPVLLLLLAFFLFVVSLFNSIVVFNSIVSGVRHQVPSSLLCGLQWVVVCVVVVVVLVLC
jgi:hypothetical protein